MNVFIDTNIFLDVILQRENKENSTIVLNAAKQGLFNGFVADITLINIDYIAKKQTTNITKFLQIIEQTFNILGGNNDIFKQVFSIKNNDFEDSLQYVLAKNSQCELIITNDNDKKFYTGNIKTLNSVEFANFYAN